MYYYLQFNFMHCDYYEKKGFGDKLIAYEVTDGIIYHDQQTTGKKISAHKTNVSVSQRGILC